MQAIAGEIEAPWKTLDLSTNLPDVERSSRLQERVYAERNERFRLDKPPLLRLLLANLPSKQKTRHLLVISYHHLLMDGWSLPLFIEEILSAYRDEASYGASPVRLTYKNYLSWVQKQSRDAAFAAWSEYLDEIRGANIIGSSGGCQSAIRLAGNVGRPKYQRKPQKKSTHWRTTVA